MMDVIVCDDHPVVRRGLTDILRDGFDGLTFREADGAQVLLDLVRERPADLVLLDIGLPGRSGLDVLRQLKHEHPRLPVLMLSVHPPDQYAVRALRAGAAGYLTKNAAPGELVQAVQVVSAGRKYLSPEVAERLAEDLRWPTNRALHDALTDREFEVLSLIGAGKRPRQIASELSLSYSTISTYRARILSKLNLKSDLEVARYALVHRLVD